MQTFLWMSGPYLRLLFRERLFVLCQQGWPLCQQGWPLCQQDWPFGLKEAHMVQETGFWE
jgi:hypothetical protein